MASLACQLQHTLILTFLCPMYPRLFNPPGKSAVVYPTKHLIQISAPQRDIFPANISKCVTFAANTARAFGHQWASQLVGLGLADGKSVGAVSGDSLALPGRWGCRSKSPCHRSGTTQRPRWLGLLSSMARARPHWKCMEPIFQDHESCKISNLNPKLHMSP
jgi:hypothetical protein